MYNKILGPLDGSKLSECTLSHIEGVATGCKVSEVVLLAVLEPVQRSSAGTEFPSSREVLSRMEGEWQKVENENKKKAEEYLNVAAEGLREKGITAKIDVIQSELDKGVAETILDYSQNNNFDLVIMSTHGRSGVTRFALGSVADKVIRHSKVPVLIVAPAGCR